jgi:hypothetical protein
MIASTNDGRWLFGSGLQAIVDGDESGIIEYELDSYYGLEFGANTKWDDANTECTLDWLWEGTTEELYHAARNCTDLMFPTRKLSETDSDYAEMMKLYTAIRGYLRKQSRKKKKRKHDNGGGFSAALDEGKENPELREADIRADSV